MATKIIDATYRFCGKWQDTHGAHLFFGGYLCPGTEGSSASTVAELATALEALLAFEADYPILEDLRAYNAARDEARALLARLKGG